MFRNIDDADDCRSDVVEIIRKCTPLIAQSRVKLNCEDISTVFVSVLKLPTVGYKYRN
jgi:hypothetical protein